MRKDSKFNLPVVVKNAFLKKIFPKVRIGKLIRVTPGKRHAWYESSVGPIRKQIQ